MATRKSGDGNANVGSDRPGSYAKVSGSRRKRKGRRSTTPPQASTSLDEASIVDTVGESDDGRSELGRTSVDDLRRPNRPTSSRAPRREIGPLGIEDIRSDPPATGPGSDPPRHASDRPLTSSDAPRLNVVEVNASQTPRSRLFEEDDDVDENDRELARQYEIDASPSDLRRSPRPARHSLSVVDDAYDAQEATHSLSSVLGARPSLRPTPKPDTEQADPASMMWWLVVSALVAIIAAAVVIAAREQFGTPEQAATEEVDSEPMASPVVEAAKPAPASFGSPQRAESKPSELVPAAIAPKPAEVAQPSPVEAEPQPAPAEPRTPVAPVAPSVVPAAQSSAVRPGVPGTSAVTGAAARTHGAPGASRASDPRRSTPAAIPSDANKAAAEGASGSYAPGYDKQLGERPYAPGYGAAVAEPTSEPPSAKPGPEPVRNDKPAEAQGLPVNPYE